MPDQIISNETLDPSTITGDVALGVTKVADIATEAVLDTDGVGIRAPSHDEGALLWEIARDAGNLDLNSPYAYMMTCRNFQSTCAIAEIYGMPAGFVMAHRPAARPHTMFVWQIAVLPEFRGFGIAKRLLDSILERDANVGVRSVEATVTPSNTASAALFTAFAAARNAKLDVRTGFTADDFPEEHRHEAERLFVISPIAAIS